MKKKKSLEHEINEFIACWGCSEIIEFLRSIIPLFELYDVEDETDWVKKEVGEEHADTVRFARTVYLMSKIADRHSAKLCTLKAEFRGLWQRMEQVNRQNCNSTPHQLAETSMDSQQSGQLLPT